MNHDMEEKGIVGLEYLPLEPRFASAEGPPPRRFRRRWCLSADRCQGGGLSAAGLRREADAVNNPAVNLHHG